MVPQDPYAFENLLPAGILTLYLDGDAHHAPVCRSDDWDTLRPFFDAHHLQVTAFSQPRLHDLEFLAKHKFVRPTWRSVSRKRFQVEVKIYLIPYDLQGVRGSLTTRNRDEAKVLQPARKALMSILNLTNRSASVWAGRVGPDDHFEPFLPQESDERTLSEIYSDLPSPVVDASTFLSGADLKSQRALRTAPHWKAPPGMRPLYAYQRRTVARMLQQELDPMLAPDPLYVPLHGVGHTTTFHLQPSTMEILRELPKLSQARGGILCEEMGTGKTFIVLALIMATKHQLSAPEKPWNGLEIPVLTPLAFRHFPQPEFGHARTAARTKSRIRALPSLVEVLTHFIKVSPECIGPPDYDTVVSAQTHLRDALQRNHPFCHVYEQIPETASPRRKGVDRGPRVVYLTSATLVIVPRALLEQWNAEINKHCDGGSLRVLRVESRSERRKTSPIPPARDLASNYDVVLITYERFAAEKARCNTSKLYSWKQCKCPDSHGSRVPNCSCTVPDSVSPLVQIRWKRLVVDEGHVSAAKSNLAVLAQGLSVERRWIVSGTPTRNLMGLSLGQSGQSSDPVLVDTPSSDEDDTCSGELVYPCDCSDDEEMGFPTSDDDGSRGLPMSVDQSDLPRPPRRWTNVDRDDLQRLGDMIKDFIGVPQFASDRDLFRKNVLAPLLDRGGPRFGATQVVSQVMSQVMIRHQIQDVERELPEKLPPLKEKTVILKFQPLAAKTYNVLQSIIAVNAVDSERKDQDYLFHPSRRAELRQTLENLTQTMFWRTDPELFDIDEATLRSENALTLARERNLPQSDISLVESSIQAQRDAASDFLWRYVMQQGDIAFTVQNLPLAVQKAWVKMDASLLEHEASLMDPDRLRKLRDFLVSYPLSSEQRVIERGFHVAAEDAENEAKFQTYIQSRKRKRGQDDIQPETLKLKQSNAKAGSKEKQQELNDELEAAIRRKERGQPSNVQLPLSTPIADRNGLFASRSFLLSPNIGNSLSSKINYILRKVMKHAAEHKFLMFSASPFSLACLADALDIAQIPYLQYTSGVKPRVRQQTVVTFETSDRYRVLLMELKLGARGLNLTSASRIIFCEPVWQGDVESQAIKRAHRIGQQSQINVETLVMRGTSEEAMVTRRQVLQRKSERLPAMEEDVSMRKFMQNPTFIRSENIELAHAPGLDFPLIPGRASRNPVPEAREASPSEDDSDMEIGFRTQNWKSVEEPLGSKDEPPSPKKPKLRVVRFA